MGANAAIIPFAVGLSAIGNAKEAALKWTLRYPANTTALVYLPFGNLDFVKANGKPIQSGKEYRIVEKLTRGTVVLSFASGRYKLEDRKVTGRA